MLTPWKTSYDQLRQHFKKQRHYFANKNPSSQSYAFSSSHVQMWDLDRKEGWEPKKKKKRYFELWRFRKALESLLDYKEIRSVNLKGNQCSILIGRTDAEAEAPILWPPDVKSQLLRQDPEAGQDWRQKEKETTEDEIIGWHHQLDGHEFEQALGFGDGQGILACSSP